MMSLVLCNIRIFFFFGGRLYIYLIIVLKRVTSLNFDSIALVGMRFRIFFSGIHFAP